DTGHSDFVYAVAFSPDGQWIASASKDRSVKVVEAASGKSRYSIGGFDDDVMAVAVAPKGDALVVSGAQPGLAWYNTKTAERVRVQTGHGVGVNELSFSRDGQLVLSAGGDGTARVWNGTTGAPLRTLAVGSMVYSAALSPDGKQAVTGSFDGLVRLWDA